MNPLMMQLLSMLAGGGSFKRQPIPQIAHGTFIHPDTMAFIQQKLAPLVKHRMGMGDLLTNEGSYYKQKWVGEGGNALATGQMNLPNGLGDTVMSQLTPVQLDELRRYMMPRADSADSNRARRREKQIKKK